MWRQFWTFRRSLACAVVATSLIMVPDPATAQKVEVRNKTGVGGDSIKLKETLSVTAKRYAFGYTNTFTRGRSLDNVVSGRFNIFKSTKVSGNVRVRGLTTDWEAKINQKIGAFTLDLGGGSEGLFHSGILYGARKGKGFGFSASWVGDNRRRGANLEIWHYIKAIDLKASARHSRRGFTWSATTGGKLGQALRGVLLYETSSGVDGHGASQQVIYGRNTRTGTDGFGDNRHFRLVPEEDVFGDDGINIKSPLYRDDDPLGWLVEGYGARISQVELDKKAILEAESVTYLTNALWVGGEYTRKEGASQSIDAKLGVTTDNLNLAATVGYQLAKESIAATFQMRWTPGRE